MAFLDNVKNFSHRPLKKRPLQFIAEEPKSDDDIQPQDLRVKRRRVSGDETTEGQITERLSTSPIPLPTYYPATLPHTDTPSVTVRRYSPPPLRLESIPKPLQPHITPLADFYLQLFHRNSVCHHKQGQKVSPWDNVWPILPPVQPSGAWTPNLPVLSASAPAVAPASSPTESHLSSPRSTSSEDSGLGNEFVSEDEVDLQQKTSLQPRVPGRHCCESCGKSYSTQSGLRKHNELHCSSLGARAFACKHCAKAYTSVGALKMHIRTHTLPCKCHVCGKAFSRPWLLQGHIRTHTGEKPFKCHQCHRSFADRSNLRAHLQTHERVKKYACHTCHKTFSRMSLLNKHSENACPGYPVSMETK